MTFASAKCVVAVEEKDNDKKGNEDEKGEEKNVVAKAGEDRGEEMVKEMNLLPCHVKAKKTPRRRIQNKKY